MHALALVPVLAQEGGGNPVAQFLPLLLIVAVFYLLLIRPQQRKAKQHQQLVQSIGTGDRVVTIGGIHGIVDTINDDEARIEIAPGTVITLTRGAIARRLTEDDDDVSTTETDAPVTTEAPAATDPTDTP